MALRTTSKAVKEKIKCYLLENFSDWYNENRDYILENNDISEIDPENFTDCCNTIFYYLYDEVIKHNKRKMSHFEYFKYWCEGLTSLIDTTYLYNTSAVDLVGGWLEQTEAEKSKYNEQQAENLVTWLLYREISAHASKRF